MRNNLASRLAIAGVLSLVVASTGTAQVRQAIKIIGVYAVVDKFGPDMNKAINKLSNHKDTTNKWTKVVPIIRIGIGSPSAIGAAQVTGTKATLAKVEAVAQPEASLFGKEITVRALIPVQTKDVKNGLKTVDGVGVSGIVDLKL